MKKLLLLISIILLGISAKAQSADELFKKGEYAKAADAYAVLYKSDTTNVLNTRRLAFCYLQTENAKHLARYYFQKALNLDANDVASNYYLGVYYKDLLAQASNDTKKEVQAKAYKYLSKAATLGSDEAKQDLKNLK